MKISFDPPKLQSQTETCLHLAAMSAAELTATSSERGLTDCVLGEAIISWLVVVEMVPD